MIKQIKLQNTFGIRELDLNFKISNVASEKRDQDNQYLIDGDFTYPLIPTFLSKNASGKTSFVKALHFILSFADKARFKSMLKTWIINTLKDSYLSKNVNTFNTSPLDTQEFTQPIRVFDGNIMAKKITLKLLEEIAYAGSEFSLMDVELFNNHNVVLKISKDSFILEIDKHVLDVTAKISSVYNQLADKLPKIEELLFRADIFEQEFENVFSFELKDFSFLENINFHSFFKDTKAINEVEDTNLKRRINADFMTLIKVYGEDVIESLLKRMDNNVNYISYDLEDKKLKIFLKDIENVSVTTNNLSFGTLKMFQILSKAQNLFDNGGVMFIDEIENGLHLSLIKLLVELFSDERINKSKAQLFLTTHNPLLIEREIINVDNVIMNENRSFVKISQINKNGRTEDKIAFIKAKNFYNDIFWIKHDKETKSTLSDIAIRRIITSMADHLEMSK